MPKSKPYGVRSRPQPAISRSTISGTVRVSSRSVNAYRQRTQERTRQLRDLAEAIGLSPGTTGRQPTNQPSTSNVHSTSYQHPGDDNEPYDYPSSWGNKAGEDDHDSDWLDEDVGSAGDDHQRPEFSAADQDFLRRQRSYFYSQKLRTLELSWRRIEKDLTMAFLVFKKRTNGWTDNNTFRNFGEEMCTCSEHQKEVRTVDVIDIIGRSRSSWTFCSCFSDPVRVIARGFIPASPDRPRTVFSIRLLDLHHSLWQSTCFSTYGFVAGLDRFLDARADTLWAAGGLKPRELRKPFSAAVDAYRRILTLTDQLFTKVLDLSPHQQLANKCPPCFGPAYNERKVSPDEPTYIAAFDGNFQQRHNETASKDYGDEYYPSTFVQPAEIKAMHDETMKSERKGKGSKGKRKGGDKGKEKDGEPEAPSHACTDAHKAADDSRNATSWKGSDDTGLMGCACRHDAILYLANIYKTGEKLYYPLAIMKKLLEEVPNGQFGFLYDIGCNVKAHIDKRGLLAEHRPRLRFGTSVFHAYAHEWPCQLFFNPRLNEYWGLSDGEGLERVWSFHSPLISQLRYATRNHRFSSLHFRSLYHNHMRLQDAAEWLVRKHKNALKVLEAAQKELTTLYVLRNTFNDHKPYDDDYFRSQWSRQKLEQGSKADGETKRKLKIASLFELQEEVKTTIARLETMSAASAVVAVKSIDEMNAQITQLGHEISDDFMDLAEGDRARQKDLLLLWNAKATVRRKVIEWREQKRPLDQAKRPGKGAKLGATNNPKIVKLVSKAKASVKEAFAKYTKRAANFTQEHDPRHKPAIPTYDQLQDLPVDDPFWNDGFFTNDNEPWAVDPYTQAGVRAVLAKDRALEELRRLGWEVRRSMSWAYERNNSLTHILSECRKCKHLDRQQLESHASKENSLTPLPPPFLSLPTLSRLPSHTRVDVVESLTEAAMEQHAKLQLRWKEGFRKVWMWTRASNEPRHPWGRMVGQMEKERQMAEMESDLQEEEQKEREEEEFLEAVEQQDLEEEMARDVPLLVEEVEGVIVAREAHDAQQAREVAGEDGGDAGSDAGGASEENEEMEEAVPILEADLAADWAGGPVECL